jgi:ferredoxin/flavodoxin---NADP+ reductase
MMERTHTILEKRQLSENVFSLRVNAPLIAAERKAGQFILLSIDGEFGERIPLTIADADPEEGSITLIFQRVGMTTMKLAEMNVGDELAVLVGPLGLPTHIENFGTVVCVGGGIGVAPMHPIVQALKAAGNKIITIIGARNQELMVLEDEMRAMSDELIVCTDDGSYGRKALVTEPLKEICERDPRPDLVVAIGPPIMMKFCAETTRPYEVHTMVSLNTIMVDGTGMCGGCRVIVGGKPKFVCVDGPEFDGHLVDFDGMMKRLRGYQPQERQAVADYEAHSCNLDGAYREATDKE